MFGGTIKIVSSLSAGGTITTSKLQNPKYPTSLHLFPAKTAIGYEELIAVPVMSAL